MILAACDLGSNSLKITIADCADRTAPNVLFEDARITRIGERLDETGRLDDVAIERTLKALERFAVIACEHGAKDLRCVATAGLRGADNAAEFIETARQRAGFEIEIIHGHREAELSFVAPSAAFGPGPLIVVDVGGRSSEIITGAAGQIDGRVSFEIGGVRMTERFLPSDPPSDDELQTCRAHVRQVLEASPEAAPDAQVVGVSGTVMALMGVHLGVTQMEHVINDGEGAALPRSAIQQAFAHLKSKTAAQRVVGSIIPKGRADVIVAGALIVDEVLERYGASEMIVSNRGVRYGLLQEMLR